MIDIKETDIKSYNSTSRSLDTEILASNEDYLKYLNVLNSRLAYVIQLAEATLR